MPSATEILNANAVPGAFDRHGGREGRSGGGCRSPGTGEASPAVDSRRHARTPVLAGVHARLAAQKMSSSASEESSSVVALMKAPPVISIRTPLSTEVARTMLRSELIVAKDDQTPVPGS